MKKIFENAKCICIDWDGTLVSTSAIIHKAYVLTMSQLGIHPDWSEADTLRQNGRLPQSIFEDTSIWGEKGLEAKLIFYSNLAIIKGSKPELLNYMPGALDFLQYLHDLPNRPKIVLIANKTQPILNEEVQSMGLEFAFDMVIGATETPEECKPYPAAFERATFDLVIQNRKTDVIHIGDNPSKDNEFANNYGATSIIINDVDSTAKDFYELLKML